MRVVSSQYVMAHFTHFPSAQIREMICWIEARGLCREELEASQVVARVTGEPGVLASGGMCSPSCPLPVPSWIRGNVLIGVLGGPAAPWLQLGGPT